ncbi:hypothetical protein Tco_0943053, partial [Tanacetum coccineum]
FALLLSLDVSSSRVRKIKENIDNHRSAIRDVFVSLAEPLSVIALAGTKGTSILADATIDATMVLSITLASVGTIVPISVDDYEVVCTDDQAAADENAVGNAEPFPNVDDAELNIPSDLLRCWPWSLLILLLYGITFIGSCPIACAS